MNRIVPSLERLRIERHNNELASQISTIILQRHNWPNLIQNSNLSSSPPLFFNVLRTIQTDPKISLELFHWAYSHLRFEPDLDSASILFKISLASGLTQHAKPLLDRLIKNNPSEALFHSVANACQGSDSHIQSLCLSFIVEAYGKMGLFRDALKVFDKMRFRGLSPSISACNELLDFIQRYNETELAWCFYGTVVRAGVSPDNYTWSLIARILSKSGRPERVSRILDMGVYSSDIYGIFIDFLSRNGNFGAVFDRLQEMCDKKINVDFSTLSSILDGACRYKNSGAIDRTLSVMAEKKLIISKYRFEYDDLIERLGGLGRSYAAEMFFRKALDEKIALKDTTYGVMLRVLSLEGRREKAIRMFRLISRKRIELDRYTCNSFGRVVLTEMDNKDTPELILDIIRRGSSLKGLNLSEFIAVMCRKRDYKVAEEVLKAILEKGLSPDMFSFCALVDHYCVSGRIDSAMALHNEVERLDVCLDSATYVVLLKGLADEKRVEEMERVLNHMRKHKRLSRDAFLVAIRGFGGANELRKAMRLHDEMLKLGLKPALEVYKKLMLLFK